MAEAIAYARNGDVHLAYQVLGGEGRDVLFLPGGTMPMDALDQHPKGLEVLAGLRRLGRLILTDQRGIGQSDRTTGGFTPEIEASDLAAVFEAADARDCTLVACFDACLAAIACAALHAERLGSLIIVNGFAHFRRSFEEPDQFPPGSLDRFHEALDGNVDEGDLVAAVAPSERKDSRFRTWFDEAGRRGASPATALQRWISHESADVTAYLADVAVPTLVLHRESNPIVSPRQASVLAHGIPRAQLVMLPGYDNMVYAGPVENVTNAIAWFAGQTGEGDVHRVLKTVMFTDIVRSTNRAIDLGDRRWATVLDIHDAIARRIIERGRGTLINTTGDGLLVTFDSPGEALHCASALRDTLADAGIEVRTGVHVGEVERRGSDIGGIAVHLAARVMATAQAGEILVSSVVPLLMSGSGTTFSARGEHRLKDIPETWTLYAADI